MAKNGRAGAALAVAALGSFFAGCVSTLLIAVASPPLARMGTLFQAPDYFSLMVLGLIGAVVLAHGSVVKALGMILLGLLWGWSAPISPPAASAMPSASANCPTASDS